MVSLSIDRIFQGFGENPDGRAFERLGRFGGAQKDWLGTSNTGFLADGPNPSLKRLVSLANLR